MRRAALLAFAALLGMVAFGLPRPPAPEGPTFTGSPLEGRATRSSVWYCPMMSAGAIRDTWLSVASVDGVEVQISLPSPIPNEEVDGSQFAMPGPGARSIEIASIVRRGDAPGFIELDNGPAAVAAVMATEGIEEGTTALTGDRCTDSVPKLWHLPGATTRTQRTSNLRLFNPFPEPAKVTVGGTSEFGDVGLLGLSAIDVPGRSWTDINLNQLVSLLDDIALTVSSDEGLVIPSLTVSTDVDEASWPGTGLATSWSFPVATIEDLPGFVVISNPGDAPLSVDIDVHTFDSALVAARTESVPAGQPVRIPLSDLADGPFGIVVRATAPVAAVVVAEDVATTTAEEDTSDVEQIDAGRIAGTVGITEPVRRWLLPGIGGIDEAPTTIWLLNSGTEVASVTVQPLGGAAIDAETFEVAPGTVHPIELRSIGVAGYLVDADSPIAAGWSIEFGGGVAFVAGSPVGG